MSSSTVTGLAQAMGMLGSGNISGLSNSQYFNLIAMALSRTSGTSIDSILQNGITASETNDILRSVIEYLQEIAMSNSQVAKSELATTFGVTMSDIMSTINLNTSVLDKIAESSMDYAGAMAELGRQLNELPNRLPLATMMSNIWSNLQWGLASNIVSNPALYGIWKVTSLIQEHTGGIQVPSIFAMGSGFNLNTSIENLVKLGVVGISSLGMIGDLISGLGNTANPAGMVSGFGNLTSDTTNLIATYGKYEKTFDENVKALRRLRLSKAGGEGLTGESGMTTSSSVIAGNSAGEDVYTSTKSGAQGEAQAEADAQKGEGDDITELTKYIKEDVHLIYELLNNTIDGVMGMKTYNPSASTGYPGM